MPNGNSWKLDFQMFILPDAADGEESNRVRKMRDKIGASFPLMASVTDVKDDIVTYTMLKANDLAKFEERLLTKNDPPSASDTPGMPYQAASGP